MVQSSGSHSSRRKQNKIDDVNIDSDGIGSKPIRPWDTAPLDIWETGEKLNDLLVEAQDLESLCSIGLQFLLDSVERKAGSVILQASGETTPFLTIHTNIPNRINSSASPEANFISLAQAAFDDHSPSLKKNGSRGERESELSIAVTIPGLKQMQGVVLIFGETLSEEQTTWLNQMVRPFGRAITWLRARTSLTSNSGGLAAVQVMIDSLSVQTRIEVIEAQVMQAVCQGLQAELGALVLMDEDGYEMVTQKIFPVVGDASVEVYPHITPSLLHDCLEARKTLRIQNTANHTLAPIDAPGAIFVRSMLCAPLSVNGQIQGAIQVFNKTSGHFNSEDEQAFNTIARLIAHSLYSARLVRRFQITNADLEASHWELLNSRNTLRALFDSIPAALYIVNQKYEIAAINMSCARRTGRIPQELVRRPCYQALYGLDQPCTGCRVGETLSNGVSTTRTERRFQGSKNEDPEPTEWEISTYPIFEENGKVGQAIVLEQDVTEKRRMESILAQSEKLAAIGQLAASVAHEINNPLTAIIANAQIIQRELPADNDLQESAEMIAQAGARAAHVVRNLLDLARKEQFPRSATHINETIRRSLALVQHEVLARSINLAFDPAPDLPVIYASQDHLLGVWLNLLLNAIDSVENSPKEIHITTRQVESSIQVTVQDNGKGISPEKMARIFEPFYTTKSPGRGTGLGLSVCQRIIKQHGGEIEVRSETGLGSAFTVILPIT